MIKIGDGDADGDADGGDDDGDGDGDNQPAEIRKEFSPTNEGE